ncbi:uncharacterized protein LOC111597228 isoform X2 [Drosophila hydei]|uniref:Uncharacterized protein LOC111597228 isoform X2 n=1 Tax=Drosophila hydei TaxID=7224 RepID=A0A6J1LLU7_DROHY|nr:uncharacterized protein LOC111597228 isoform X2 [Drosophila hydei]
MVSKNLDTAVPLTDNICASPMTPIVETSLRPMTLSSPTKATNSTTQKTNIAITPPVSSSSPLSSSLPSSSLPSSSPPSSSSIAEVKTEPISDELSAVDFIAQLTATDDGDSNNYFELSPEEMSMNAKFGCSQSSIPSTKITKPEDDLAIGKILQLQDMDIMHATLNVNGREPNVLSISPNATKLESSARSNDVEVPIIDNNNEEQSSLLKFKPLRVTAPKHVYTNTKKKNVLSDSPTSEELITVPEIKVAGEKNQIAKPIPYKPKKGKINLVQRNKKANIAKPKENLGENLPEEQSHSSDKDVSTDITELKDAHNAVQSAQNILTETLEAVAENKNQLKQDLNENSTDINAPEMKHTIDQSKAKISEKQREAEPENRDKEQSVNDNSRTTETVMKNIENVASTSGDKIVISNKTERVISQDSEDENQIRTNLAAVNTTKERDLSQLYHPPKVPKLKPGVSNKKDNHNGIVHDEGIPASASPPAVSLFDVVKQKQPPPQEALGIQNLVNHLAAENVVPHSKEVKSESTAKPPRKKLVKTRPVLIGKRPAKAAQPHSTAAGSEEVEPIPAIKTPLNVESKTNGAHRVKTSSTSDDDGDFFHGFEETSRSKRMKHSKSRETDISDDASPDYDETEEEPHSDVESLANKSKTEPAVNNNMDTKTIHQEVEAEPIIQEAVAPIETAKQESLKKVATKRKSGIQDTELQTKPKRARRSMKAKDAKNESEPTVKVKSPEPTDVKEVEKVTETNTSAQIATDQPTIVKKRRGRPPKSAKIADSTVSENSSVQPTTVTSTPNQFITPTPKRRGRKPKQMEGVNDTPESCQQTSDYYMRLLLIRNRSQLETDEELREDGRGEGDLQCGLCLVRCNNATWQTHLAEHYGVGWHVKEPTPMLTRNSVIKMIKSYMDAGGTKRLSCRLCNNQLTTALGMIMHVEGCGDKERIVCEQCKGSYSKLFYPTHCRTCPKRVRVLSDEEQVEPEVDNTPVYSNTGRAKRKSTLKAETKLEKIAIQAASNKDFEDEVSDYEMTADKESSDEEESDGSNISEEHAKPAIKRDKILCGRLDVRKGMKERWNFFVRTNYAKDALYPNLLPCYEKLSPAEAKDLLPSMESTSMRYAYGRADDNAWMHLRPQEGFNKKNESVRYLGTPIKELAWVPLPSTVSTQYLLCSQRNKVLGYSRQFKDKPEKALLLLLECKMSTGGEDKVFPLQIRLHYSICVPQGPVHSIAFMPSGGYDESNNRLGLLAVGSLSGAVIYALPIHPKNDSEQTNKQLDVIVLQPMLTLTLDIDNPMQDACTKICWSESFGHHLIVTGYASGNVAFYDISDDQELNRMERNNQSYCVPAHFFYFGERNIYYLDLHYDTNGARWLAVGTSVRKLWIYDIANLAQPLPIMGDTVCNMYLGGLTWPSLWESLAVGSTEVYKSKFPRVVMVNPSGITLSHSTLDLTLSSPRSVHFNWEQLTLVTVTDNGDVTFLYCDQFNMVQKRSTDCRSVSTMDVCCLSGTPESNSVTPEEFKQDYGLLIKPFVNVIHKKKKATYLNIKRRPNFDLSNLMRLNCVRWNWNVGARNWVAVGAEHGLLRIINFEADKHFKYF